MKKIIVAIVALFLVFELFTTYNFFRSYFEYASYLRLRDILRMVYVLVPVFLFVHFIKGLILFFREKKNDLNKHLSYAVYFIFLKSVFSLLTLSLKTSEIDVAKISAPTLYYVFLIAQITIVGLIIYHYFFQKEPHIAIEVKNVSSGARFKNRIIDIFFILYFSYFVLPMLASGYVFEEVEFLNSNPYWMVTFITMIYYFLSEWIFESTLGKLHNDSFVNFEREKTSSVLFRTLSRFIPLDALTFVQDENGWHDKISKTKVVVVKKESESMENQL